LPKVVLLISEFAATGSKMVLSVIDLEGFNSIFGLEMRAVRKDAAALIPGPALG
jgi:hypothetical protein